MSKLPLMEYIMHSTVRIETTTDTGDMASGTGFFITLPNDKDESPGHLCLITNRHVFKDADTVRIVFTTADADDNPVYGKQVGVNIQHILEANLIKFHPNPKIDLAMMPMDTIIKRYWGQGVNHFFTYISYHSIPNENVWNNMDAVENLLMVGYPNGIWDEIHNLPIFRRGITASHPAFNFNNEPIFLGDIACFPGSSGSPVFLYDEFLGKDRETGKVSLGKRQLLLLGILSSGPVHHQHILEPSLEATENKSIQFINLGNIIKSTTLFDFITNSRELI